jgi:hypothetical protein
MKVAIALALAFFSQPVAAWAQGKSPAAPSPQEKPDHDVKGKQVRWDAIAVFRMQDGKIAEIYLERGALDESAHAAEKAHSLAPWSLPAAGQLAGVLARTGDTSGATAVLRGLGDGTAYGALLGFVGYYLTCSEIGLAADYAEKAIAQRQPMVTLYMRLPLAKELRASPRWPALAKMMNLSDVP